MKTRDKLLVASLAGAGALWGARAWLRSRRRIGLTDRVVTVTGASTGHGFLVAKYAAERHAHLVIAARHAEALADAEANLLRFGAASVLSVPTDVRDAEQARNLVDRTLDVHGRLDILINNAGIINVGPVATMTLEDFRDAMATNFWGAVYTTLAAIPHMKAQGFGRIGNVVSVGGKRTVPHMLPYSASKFALTGFTEALRSELVQDNILVTGVYPSTMRTGGHAHAQFKGNKEAEFAWFALSDSLPIISTSAERVARQLWEGVLDGIPEVIVGWPARLAVTLQGLFPNEVTELMALANGLLPPPRNIGAPACSPTF